MTDWKELARKHEESANEYARMNYELEAIIADLLEALGSIHSALDMCGPGNSKAQLLGQIRYANGQAVQALRKATE